jgi:four helix bundle protein
MARTTTRFEQLNVWQKSKTLAVAVYKTSSQGDFARDFGLRDQLRRAAVSVMSNIAEGFGRFTRPEFRRFLTIARGSVAEVQSQLYLAHDLGYPLRSRPPEPQLPVRRDQQNASCTPNLPRQTCPTAPNHLSSLALST